MKVAVKLMCALALALLWAVTPVLADVPTEMSVQGRLTNGAGAPVAAGLKLFTFKIYDAPAGGSEIWPGGPGEIQPLATDANGLWNAGVGELIPLTEAVFQSPVRWLEVTVNDGVNPIEILPRIELRTNPYTYRAATSEQADSLGGSSLSDLVDQFVDEAGDDMTGRLSNNWSHKNLGTSLQVDNPNDGWGTYWTDGVFGTWGLGADVSGDNNYWNIAVAGAARGNNNQFEANRGVLGMADGSGTANVGVEGYTLLNGGATANYSGYFHEGDFLVSNPQTAGTGGVLLPPDAIDDTEILDEPGISQNVNTSSTGFNTVSMTDIAITSITIPDGGYIVVEGTTNLYMSGTAGASNWSYLQIDETSGGTPFFGYYSTSGFDVAPNTGNFYFSATARKTYFKSAGTYTFRLEGQGLGASNGCYYSTITAVFYPVSYGSVTTVASSEEAVGFSDVAVAPRPERNGPQATTAAGSSEIYTVDLRELELKVARAEAEVEQARRELVEAKLSAANSMVRSAGASVKEPKR